MTNCQKGDSEFFTHHCDLLWFVGWQHFNNCFLVYYDLSPKSVIFNAISCITNSIFNYIFAASQNILLLKKLIQGVADMETPLCEQLIGIHVANVVPLFCKPPSRAQSHSSFTGFSFSTVKISVSWRQV